MLSAGAGPTGLAAARAASAAGARVIVADENPAPGGWLRGERLQVDGEATDLACDLVAVSGGWSPTIHLHAQAGGRPDFDERIGAFVPAESAGVEACAGVANVLIARSVAVSVWAWLQEAARPHGYTVGGPIG